MTSSLAAMSVDEGLRALCVHFLLPGEAQVGLYQTR
jgi:Sec7-like guanine-nucleotide exchange factor